MLPIQVPSHFRIIAHRGASAYAPENTHAAFQMAKRMGVTEVELDAQLTLDGQIAICHDSTLARYGHGSHMVEQMQWAELASLDMGSWFSPFLYANERMITLEDLFATYGKDFTYHVEIKGKVSALPAAVLASIQRHNLREQCIVTSFNYDALVVMRDLDKELPLGWLVQKVDAGIIAQANALRLYQLCPVATTISAVQVAQARTVVSEVRAWGLQGETIRHYNAEVIALIQKVVACGCDGMTINWPDWVRNMEAGS